jgi:hypothetical protein
MPVLRRRGNWARRRALAELPCRDRPPISIWHVVCVETTIATLGQKQNRRQRALHAYST